MTEGDQPGGLTYQNALTVCKSHGAIMAEPGSNAENEYIKNIVRDKGVNFWIGKFVSSVANL